MALIQAGQKILNEESLKGANLKESDIARVGGDIYRRDLAKETNTMEGTGGIAKWAGGRGTDESDLAFNTQVYATQQPVESTNEVINQLPDENQITVSQNIRQNQINEATNEAERNIAELKQQQEIQTQADIKTEEANIKAQQGKIDETVDKMGEQYEPFQKDYADKYNEQFETEQMIGDYKELAYDLKGYAQSMEEDLATAGAGATLESFASGRRNSVKETYNSKIATTQAAMSALKGAVNMVYTHIDRGVNQITNDRNNQINFLNMIKGMAEVSQTESKSSLITLNNEEKAQINNQIKDLEAKNLQIQATKNYVQGLIETDPMLVTKANILLTDSQEEIFDKMKKYYTDNPTLTSTATKYQYKEDKDGNPVIFNPDTGRVSQVLGYDPITGVETDPSKVIGDYDFTSYASDSKWGGKIKAIITGNGTINTGDDIEKQIPSSSVLSGYGEEIYQIAKEFDIDPSVFTGLMEHESFLGNSNVAKSNNNFGGITWNENFPEEMKGTARPSGEGGNYVKFDTIEDGLRFQAGQLVKRKMKVGAEDGGVISLSQKDASKMNNEIEKNKVYMGLNVTNNTLRTLDTFETNFQDPITGGINKYGYGSTTADATHKAILMQLKELFNLGVLNGPDLELMESILVSPTSWTGTYGKNVLDPESAVQEGIDVVKEMLLATGENEYNQLVNHYRGYRTDQVSMLKNIEDAYTDITSYKKKNEIVNKTETLADDYISGIDNNETTIDDMKNMSSSELANLYINK